MHAVSHVRPPWVRPPCIYSSTEHMMEIHCTWCNPPKISWNEYSPSTTSTHQNGPYPKPCFQEMGQDLPKRNPRSPKLLHPKRPFWARRLRRLGYWKAIPQRWRRRDYAPLPQEDEVCRNSIGRFPVELPRLVASSNYIIHHHHHHHHPAKNTNDDTKLPRHQNSPKTAQKLELERVYQTSGIWVHLTGPPAFLARHTVDSAFSASSARAILSVASDNVSTTKEVAGW